MDSSNIALAVFNSTATIGNSFGISPESSYRLIGLSVAALVIGYISLLIISLDKKKGNFSNYKYYEKLMFSYFIGGVALSAISILFSVINLLLADILYTPQKLSEISVLGIILTASMFSSVVLYISTEKTKNIDVKAIVKYFVFNSIIIFAVIGATALILFLYVVLKVIGGSFEFSLKVQSVVLSFILFVFPWLIKNEITTCLKKISHKIEQFFDRGEESTTSTKQLPKSRSRVKV